MSVTKWILASLVLMSQLVVAIKYPPMPSMYAQIAKENKVPASVFYALVLNESKSKVKHKDSLVLPWPWTVNHRGTSHFFQTKKEAHQFIESLINRGDESFDVGFGQVNWYWHKNKFNSSWDALDPYTNLTVAAKYLRQQFERQECNTWTLAIGCYHRPAQSNKDKKIAKKYSERVLRIWAKLEA